jgi:hypothetical protein
LEVNSQIEACYEDLINLVPSVEYETFARGLYVLTIAKPVEPSKQPIESTLAVNEKASRKFRDSTKKQSFGNLDSALKLDTQSVSKRESWKSNITKLPSPRAIGDDTGNGRSGSNGDLHPPDLLRSTESTSPKGKPLPLIPEKPKSVSPIPQSFPILVISKDSPKPIKEVLTPKPVKVEPISPKSVKHEPVTSSIVINKPIRKDSKVDAIKKQLENHSTKIEIKKDPSPISFHKEFNKVETPKPETTKHYVEKTKPEVVDAKKPQDKHPIDPVRDPKKRFEEKNGSIKIEPIKPQWMINLEKKKAEKEKK